MFRLTLALYLVPLNLAAAVIPCHYYEVRYLIHIYFLFFELFIVFDY